MEITQSDGCFGDVGGNDALADAVGRVIENLILFGHRKGTVKRQNDPALILKGVLADHLLHAGDFIQTAEKDQQISALLFRIFTVDQLQDSQVRRWIHTAGFSHPLFIGDRQILYLHIDNIVTIIFYS